MTMAGAPGGSPARRNPVDRDRRGRRISRPALYLIVFAAVGLLAWASPRGLTAVHVGFNAVAGLVWLAFAVVARKWPDRIRGIPVWLGFLALAACFLTLAILEARDRLG
jgi:hypothetical protein